MTFTLISGARHSLHLLTASLHADDGVIVV